MGNCALAAMSGLFGISEAKAKEIEYSSNSLLERPEAKSELIKTQAEQRREEKSHEQQSINLLESKQKNP